MSSMAGPSTSGPVLVNAPPLQSTPQSQSQSQTPSQPPSLRSSTASKPTSSKPSSSKPPSSTKHNLSSTLPHPSTLPLSPESQRQIHESRTALLAQMNAIGQHATQELQGRAKDLHGNVKGIEEQEKGLEAGVKGLRKERERLEKVVAEGGRVVKELGNVQNWAEVLERDFLVLGETIRLANGGSESESSWSSYSGSESGDDDRRGSEQEGVSTKEDGESTSTQRTTDGEGDVLMHDTGNENEIVDKGKGKEGKKPVEIRREDTKMQTDNQGVGLSTAATVVGSSSASGTEPSGGDSVHPAHSTTS